MINTIRETAARAAAIVLLVGLFAAGFRVLWMLYNFSAGNWNLAQMMNGFEGVVSSAGVPSLLLLLLLILAGGIWEEYGSGM
ncbi:hypothetical protein PN419_07670 [Halorubrum ezzemoulense]|jgi:hypothetical protein|uniref:hypothetical protein n=1 Tax=Halorubrum ezzemoulense TaxID=337243 RepID=UPI00232F7B70|nr:hypothetical protein [Halorubrum ezzemoulense]MDB9248890.1 hypothetical protein [Halorubrum ezzemoulense]MDB9258772.1 hypothetical protein [Halorubrum ezzemoulense]MDB9262649.1 hypothetical protein [Halorubrum ezzemoulense]MDB9265791.1 hypothetical protein [Halorubrum ezzemoulense]MDB9269133.1 hypothetical protein [Halorubrum ezzemoulense]